MYSANDTIVALATPPGRGGLAVVRLSGGDALKICGALVEPDLILEPRRATLTRVEAESLRDEAVVTWFRAPASFTGEDVVEFSLHGSPLLASRVIASAVRAGARMARAGEFTLRAFLNGKLDLAQAEAVQDLVSATTPQQARMAFDQLQGTLSERIGAIERELFELTARLEASIDFPEEGYHFVESGEVAATLRAVEGKIDALIAAGRRGRMVRDGVTAALVGRTNVGKSTIFNALAGGERAIVTEVPGTTRDVLTETVAIEGVAVTIVDTAGTRETTDPVEREGVRRAEQARHAADLLIVVLDRAAALTREDRQLLLETASRPRIVVANKCDVPAAWEIPAERRHLQVEDTCQSETGASRRDIQVEDTGQSETRASRRHGQVGDTGKSETRASRRHLQVEDTGKSETRASRRHLQVEDTGKSETRASRRHLQVEDTGQSETRASRRDLPVEETGQSETRASRRDLPVEDTRKSETRASRRDLPVEDTRKSETGASRRDMPVEDTGQSQDGTSDVEESWLEVAAKDGRGVDALIMAIARKIGGAEASEAPIISNVRHLELLQRAKVCLGETLEALDEQGHMPEETVLSDLAQTSAILGELTGQRSTEELLEEIFSKFCVGK